MSDELRALFKREAERLEVPRSNLVEVLRDGRRRSLLNRAGYTAMTAVILVAAIVATSRLADGGDATPVVAEDRVVVVSRIPLDHSRREMPDYARDLTHGFGSVWAVHDRDGTLQQIDPETDRVTNVFQVVRGATERRPVMLNDIEAGAGALWVSTALDTRHVLKIDPSSGEILGRIEGVRPLNLYVFDNLLWIHGGSSLDRDSLYKIDPQSLQIIDKVQFDSECCVEGIASSGDSLWVSHRDSPDAPSSGSVLGGTAVYDLQMEVIKLDPERMEIEDTIPLRERDKWMPGDAPLGSIAAAHGYLWVARPESGFVDRVDPDSGEVVSIEIEAIRLPDDPTPFGGSIWVWAMNGSEAVPIDPRTLKVGRAVDLGEPLDQGVVEGAGSLWVASLSQDTGKLDSVLRIDTPGS